MCGPYDARDGNAGENSQFVVSTSKDMEVVEHIVRLTRRSRL